MNASCPRMWFRLLPDFMVDQPVSTGSISSAILKSRERRRLADIGRLVADDAGPPHADRVMRQGLIRPCSRGLTDEELDYVCNLIRDVLVQRGMA